MHRLNLLVTSCKELREVTWHGIVTVNLIEEKNPKTEGQWWLLLPAYNLEHAFAYLNYLLTGNMRKCHHLNIDIGRFSLKPPLYGKTKGRIGSKKEQRKHSSSDAVPLRHSKARHICHEIKDHKKSFKSFLYVYIYVHIYLTPYWQSC